MEMEQDKIMDFDLYMSQLKEYALLVKEVELKCDVYEIADAFYYQHRLKHGSYKPLISDPIYETLMSDRYKTLVGQVKDSIECKVEMLNE